MKSQLLRIVALVVRLEHERTKILLLLAYHRDAYLEVWLTQSQRDTC